MIDLERKKSQRFKVLEEIYNQSGGDEMVFISIDEVCQKIGVPKNEIDALSQYLEGEMLLERRTMNGDVSITHYGIKEIEEAHENPNQATEHFSAINNNIIIVENMNQSQIQQGARESTQIYEKNISKDIVDILATLLKDVEREDVDPNLKEAVKANIEILKSQVLLPSEFKDKSLIKRSWDFLSKSSDLISVVTFISQHSDKILPLLGL